MTQPTKSIYTLIAYIPSEDSWHDRCGDYHKGKESEIKISYFTDVESAGEAMGQSKFNDQDTEFTILVNGLNEDEYHEFLSLDEQMELEAICENIRNISAIKIQELAKINLEKEEQERIKKEQAQLLQQKKQKDLLEQTERAQLAQLQAKYGSYRGM